MESILTDFMIPIAIWMTVIAAAIAFLFSIGYTIVNLIHSPGETIKGLLGVLAFIVILFFIWQLVPVEMGGMFAAAKYNHITESVMRLIEAGIYVSLGLSAFALGSIFLAEVVNTFR